MHSVKEVCPTPCKGIVTIGYRNKRTGLFSPVVRRDNLVMYGAADAMARLVSGDTRYAISHMYYHYDNSATPVEPEISRELGGTFFQGLNSSSLTTEDWIRIPIFSAAKIDAYAAQGEDASVYAGNMATFVATSAAHPTQTGESPAANPFRSDAGSQIPSSIVSVALVSAPGGQASAQDVVFSRLALSTPIVVQENSYVDCFWSIAFK